MAVRESIPVGLSTPEVAASRKKHGFNELPVKREQTVWHVMLEVVREPMFLLLIAAGAIYLLLGDPADALMLLGFVFITMGITIVQERRTERALARLKDLSSPRALVVRDGAQVRIPGREVVPGDLLVLEEGDRIAADGMLVEAHDLLVDESLLTGESVAVLKHAAGSEQRGSETDAGMRVYSGSMIVQGGGLARVTATGVHTSLGKIGTSLKALEPGKSLLQLEIASLVKRFAVLAIVLSLCVFVLYGWTRHDWLNGLLAGITLAMSILPEEFTVILTVFMALGAWRISNHHVLTRHMPVIEALGSTTVLCVDKTGTLTQNRMSVKTIVAGNTVFSMHEAQPGRLPDQVRHVLEYAVLASEVLPFDPMEQAFHRCLDEVSPDRHATLGAWSLVHDYPLTRQVQAMTHLWRLPGETAYLVAVKGGPESVARLCRLDAARFDSVLKQVDQLAAQGQRVLGVAQARYLPQAEPTMWPEGPEAFDFVWLGLVGLADPIRPEVPAAVKECRQAGVRVVMITGDYPSTAQAIARDAGLPSHIVATGTQLEQLDAAGFGNHVRTIHVFARILPEQKLRLVNAFKTAGDIVAMTGDGVNDAPALKAAHVGIAMGQRGTDVAREAASLVLLNDDFASIVRTIRLGRRIYDNLRKAMTYVVAVHTPIVGMTLLPLLAGTPLVFSPIHIVFLEMIINPACAIVFETERAEHDVMQRPPRSIDERLFGLQNVLLAALQGCGLLAAVSAVFLLALWQGRPEGQARALAFVCVVLGNLALIVVNRSSSNHLFALLKIPNWAQWWVLGVTVLALFAAMQLEPLRLVFHFVPVGPSGWVLPAIAVAGALVWFEFVKYVFNMHSGKKVRPHRHAAEN